MALFVRRRWPRAVAAVAVVAAVLLAVTLVTDRDDGGSGRAAPSATPTPTDAFDGVPDPALPSVALDAVLAAPDPELKSYVDHQVTAAAVPVQSVVAGDALWIGDSTDTRVLVVLTGTSNPFRFEAGTRLSFLGTLRPLSPEFARALGLRGADLREVARQGTYVEITEYRTV